MGNKHEVKGCCPLDCQDTCSWVAHVEDGKVIRLSGRRDHPFTRGALCAKVNDYQTRTYADDRLLYPLRRIGNKGEGNFERISWDDAVDVIVQRFSSILEDYGAEALLPHHFLGSMGMVQKHSLMRLFHVLGASQMIGSICGAAGNALVSEGFPIGFDPEDIAQSELIIIWGANILSTCHHHWHFIQEAQKKRGAKTICIDPRTTQTAKLCDQHIPIIPGTDKILALGIAHLLFEQNLVDLDFANQVAADVEDYRLLCKAWTPSKVAEQCGIEEDAIRQIASAFGNARPAVIQAGIGIQQRVDGEDFLKSISALAILAGHWTAPGGGLFIEAYPHMHIENVSRPDLMPSKSRQLDMSKLGNTLTDSDLSPPIKGLMIWGTNPAVVLPDAQRVRKGLAREDLFTVVLEHFMNDTARYADIILPSTTQLEHYDILGSWGHHYISVNNPAIAPLGETRSHGELLRMLARRMNLNVPELHETDEAIAAAAIPSTIDFQQLADQGWIKSTPPPFTFESKSKKLTLGWTSKESQTTDENSSLQLLTPKSHYFMNSSFANMARHRKAMNRPILDMNPKDAHERGLVHEQQIEVSNHQGSFSAWLNITADIRVGVVSLPGKWWSFPDESNAVANILTPSKWSPSGQPAFNDTHVKVRGLDHVL